MVLAGLIPAGFIAGALLAGFLLHEAPSAVRVDVAQPLVVVTYWQGFGAALWVALLAAVVIASVGYVGVLRAGSLSAAPRKSVQLTTAICAASCAAALAFPVVFSSDAYAYAAYGDMTLHAVNPYAHSRILFRDPLIDAALWQWGNPPPVAIYGPLFIGIARICVALFAHFGAAAPLFALRALACTALCACAPLAYWAFAPFSARVRLAAASGIALNPIAIWVSAEGHNDALLLALVLLGFGLTARTRPFAGALIIALAAFVKAPALAAAAGSVLAAWRDRERFARILGGAASGTAIAVLASGQLEWGVRAHLAPHGQYNPQFSPQSTLAVLFGVPVAVIITAAIALAFVVPGARKLARGNLEGALPIALGTWLAVPNPYPWYALWILPVAFLAWETPAAYAIVAASLLIVVRYYPDATNDLSAWSSAAIAACAFGVPLLILGAGTARANRDRRESRTTAPEFARLHSP